MNNDFGPVRKMPKPDIEIDLEESIKKPMANKTSLLPHKHLSKIRKRQPLTKVEKWLVGFEILIIIVAIAALIYWIINPTKISEKHVTTTKKTATVTITRSRLTGVSVSSADYALPVTGVMIENSDQARPQSGLSQAGVVFEAIAEGGITRFLALFEEGQPNSIGPIRSARPYYVDWLLPFDASYAHVGGSPDGLSAISTYNVKDLDEFYNGGSYTRISSRIAPHNVYTSMSSLLSLEKSKGYATSNFTGFPRKDPKALAVPNASKIDLNIAGPDYAVHYDYNKTTNSYDRSEAGVPMVDANTSKQLSPNVVIAIVVPISQGALDASGAYYSEYADVGSGKAYIFQDGNVTVGTWSKSSPTSQILFGDANGSPVPLNAGQTWITALGTDSLISYTK
jgi:hypothetical protein